MAAESPGEASGSASPASGVETCANPSCGRETDSSRVVVGTKYIWDLPDAIVVVCSRDCVEGALEALR